MVAWASPNANVWRRSWGRSGLMWRSGSVCSASWIRPMRSRMVLMLRPESRPSGRRLLTDAADRNNAVESLVVSNGRSTSR